MRGVLKPVAVATSTSFSNSSPNSAIILAGRQRVVAPVSTTTSFRVTERICFSGINPRLAADSSARLIIIKLVY